MFHNLRTDKEIGQLRERGCAMLQYKMCLPAAQTLSFDFSALGEKVREPRNKLFLSI